MSQGAQSSLKAWTIIIPCLIAVMLSVTHTLDGVALSMDSLYYFRTAMNIANGSGISQQTFAFVGDATEPMTAWPPGYPLLLAVVIAMADLLGISDRVAVGILNVICLLITLLVFYRIVNRVVDTRTAAIFASLIALVPSSQLIHIYAWSEVLFVPLTLVGYLFLMKAVDGSRPPADSQRALMVSVLLFAAATYVRYVGLPFFAAAMTVVLMYGRGTIGDRIRHAAIASAAFVAALVPLFWRNLTASGALSGMDRGTPNIDFLSDVATLGTFLYLEFFNVPLVLGIGALALSAAIAAAVLRWSQLTKDPAATGIYDMRYVVAPAIFAMSYLAFLVLSRQMQTIDLDTRMISVVVPYILLAVAGIYACLAGRVGTGAAASPLAIPAILLLINAIGTHTQIIEGWRQSGEPGRVLAMTYPSLSATRFDVLRGISREFAVPDGGTVFTDLSRPIVVQHLYPNSTVRRLPDESGPVSWARLEEFGSESGIIIVSTPHWWDELQERFNGRTTLTSVIGQSGNPEWLIIALPLEST